jgi:hypothetical protein
MCSGMANWTLSPAATREIASFTLSGIPGVPLNHGVSQKYCSTISSRRRLIVAREVALTYTTLPSVVSRPWFMYEVSKIVLIVFSLC